MEKREYKGLNEASSSFCMRVVCVCVYVRGEEEEEWRQSE